MSFLISTGLHLILAMSIWFNTVQITHESDLKIKKVDIEILNAQASPTKSISQNSKSNKRPQIVPKGLTAEQAHELFFPKTQFGEMPQQVHKNTIAEREAEVAANSFEGRMKASGLNQIFGASGNQNWAHYKEIYERINSNLQFDSILAQYNHYGAVLVQFNLDDHGLLLLGTLKVKAKDPILKVHVLRAMKSALSNDLEVTKKNKLDSNINYHAQFNFHRGSIEENFNKQTRFGQPDFYFARSTGEKPIADSLGEELLDARLLANPLLIAEKIEKYNRKKRRENLRFDPFESYRRDPFYLL